MQISIRFVDDCISKLDVVQKVILQKGFEYSYDKNTLVIDMFRSILEQSKLRFPQIEMERKDNGEVESRIIGYTEVDKYMLYDLFHIVKDGKRITLWDTTVRIDKLLKYLNIDNTLELFLECDFSGEGTLGIVDGVEYYYNSDEGNHKGRPHVHVKYRGIKMSIDIINLCRLNKKKRKHEKPIVNELERRAVECVRKHKKTFLVGWNDHTNGMLVDISKYIDEEPWNGIA